MLVIIGLAILKTEGCDNMKDRKQFIILFNTGKYWGGHRGFVKLWYKAHAYSNPGSAKRAAKHTISRKRAWYGDTETVSFKILEVTFTLGEVVTEEKI